MKLVRVGEDVTVVVELAPTPGVEAHTIVDHGHVSHGYPETPTGARQGTFKVEKAYNGQGAIVCALYDEGITWLRGWVDLNGPEAKALLAAYALRIT